MIYVLPFGVNVLCLSAFVGVTAAEGKLYLYPLLQGHALSYYLYLDPSFDWTPTRGHLIEIMVEREALIFNRIQP